MEQAQFFTDKFNILQSNNGLLASVRKKAFDQFNKLGVPTVKHEEWKYTRISSLFKKSFAYNVENDFLAENISDFIKMNHLPGHENANVLVFVNGRFSMKLSSLQSDDTQIIVRSLEDAAQGEYKAIIEKHLGYTSLYQKDGINALNTAFIHRGLFLLIKKNVAVRHPIYFYHITDSQVSPVLSQPRTLIYVEKGAQLRIVETHLNIGSDSSFSNQVTEAVVEDNAVVDYYIIQNEPIQNNHVCTTHFQQIGVSKVNAVTVTLNGGLIRNNMNIVMDAAGCESHLYGLYLVKGTTHIDNHTIVDNLQPNCFSNELYKGIIDENATGVFNGKIFVRKDAQKTNAYQSNKNILLSDTATVNTKPQLEIFADDVKCSHGCTVGRLDDEALFYLRTRGINKQKAQNFLLHAFANDILNAIQLAPVREHVRTLIEQRLEAEV